MASVSQHRQSLARHYKVHIQLKERSNQKKKKIDSWASVNGQEKGERMISYWCFSPGYSMQDLKNQGVKSIILTSGTLSPIESFTAELQIPFPVRLENSHVIQKHQVWLGTLGCGPDGTVLNSNYQNRFTDAYQSSLGNAIVNFARVVPNGLLVFFPSYPVMEKCVEKWRNSNIWERIVAYKPVVLEPRGQDAFMEAIDDFYKKINDETMNGAVFMAVCRGKVSEGLDFADMNGRAVVLTGLPFPPMKDPRVILKMQHLDDLTGKEGYKSFTGQQWYRQQATRAVNQAIGRVIRHKDDFGAILLCDSRFSASESIMGLPMWIKPYVTKYDNFGRAIKDMLVFFKLAEKVLPAPQRRPNRQKSGGRPGCAGAYFEPTVSRHKVSLEPASYVQCHVPGLSKRKHLEDDISSLKSQYSKSDGNTAHDSGNQRKGLLHALDSTEKCIGSYNNMQEPQSNSFEGTVTIHPKRRKIIIKPTGYAAAASSGKPAVSTSDSSSNKTPGSRSGVHLNRAENYVSELKAVLTTLEYKNFSSALQEYKKSGNLNAVTPVLADLFTSNPGRSHLFCKFYRFVRPHHKAEFEQLSLSLTGQSCGYKPEHALTNKRLGPASAQVSAGSQSKLSSISSISKSSLGRWSSVDLPVSTSQRSFLPESASRAQNGPTTLTSISTACHSSNISTANLQSVQLAHSALGGNSSLGLNAGNEDDISQVDNLTTAKSSNFSDDTRLRNSSQDGESSHLKTSAYSLTVKTAMGNHTSGTTVLLNKPEKSDQALKTMSVTDHDKSEHSRTGGCSLEVNVEKIHSMQNETNKNHPDTGYRCIKCKQKAHVPFQLPACGHICCFRCWDRILTDDKRCPGGCGELFRRRHLQQLMFGSGDDIRCSSGPKPNIRQLMILHIHK